ncbi:MAG: PAS domain S-box protein [Magnetococcales bacterium]|nr:PAS domain S-box protein [Magnetococcales bacterium]
MSRSSVRDMIVALSASVPGGACLGWTNPLYADWTLAPALQSTIDLLPLLGIPLVVLLGWHLFSVRKLVYKLRAEIDTRSQAQETLKRNRESLARAQAIAHLGNWDWDLKTGSFTCSDEVFRIFGLSPDGSLPSLEAYLNTFQPEERQRFHTALKRQQDGDKSPIRQERRIVRPNGDIRTVREVAEVQIGQHGRPEHIMGTIYDVTGRIRAENALRASEERFRSLAQSAKDAIISTDFEGKILFWNTGAKVIFGFSEAESLGQKLALIIPERYRQAHALGMQRVSETGCFKSSDSIRELVGLRRDGSEFPLEISMASWLSGEKRFFSAIIRDISSRRRLEQEQDRAFQVRITISALLETALEPLSLSVQLNVALDIIQSIPWLSSPRQGLIYLVDSASGHMVPGSQRGILPDDTNEDKLLEAQDELARFLWQPALAEHRIIFVTPEMEQRTNIPPCGRYCIPITYNDRLLGAMVLFRAEGVQRNSDEEEGVLQTIAHTLAGIIERRRMEGILEQTTLALRETRLEIIRRLGRASEFRDNETGLHVVRMSHYAAVLGKAAGMSPAECELILHAAPMHDVGKIGIPDTILRKPGKLTKDEFDIMRKHAEIGASMLFGYEDEPLKTAHVMALTHHERWDGTGYPSGLKGEEIPLVGRICAVADVFDALTTARPYKKAWSPEEATAEIQRSAGTHFDPEIVKLFMENLPDIIEIMHTYADPETEEHPFVQAHSTE